MFTWLPYTKIEKKQQKNAFVVAANTIEAAMD